MKKILASLGMMMMLTNSSVHAALIDHGDYTTDTVTGLEWYDVSLTAGQSYLQTEAQLSNTLAGWRIANYAEVSQLFTDSQLPPVTGFAQGDTSLMNAVTQFTNLLGVTLTPAVDSKLTLGVSGFFGSPEVFGGYYEDVIGENLEILYSIYHPQVLAANRAEAYISDTDWVWAMVNSAYAEIDKNVVGSGTFLVRGTSVLAVPEASTSASFSVGLLMAIFHCRQRRNKATKAMVIF